MLNKMQPEKIVSSGPMIIISVLSVILILFLSYTFIFVNSFKKGKCENVFTPNDYIEIGKIHFVEQDIATCLMCTHYTHSLLNFIQLLNNGSECTLLVNLMLFCLRI